MEKNRVYSYDLIKSIAIFMVCLYHFGTINYSYKTLQTGHFTYYFKYFLSGITCTSVPLFLMINGALLLNSSFNLKRHINKIFYIYLLFLVWGAITLVAEAPYYGDHYTPFQFIASMISSKQGRLDHLWFLQVLAYLYIMFPLIKTVYDKNETKLTNYVLGIIFFFTFGIVLLQDIINAAAYLLDSQLLKINIVETVTWLSPFGTYFPNALVYFLLGGLITKHINRINIKAVTAGAVLLVSWLALFAFSLWKTHITKSLYDVSFSGYQLIMPLIMTVSVFFLCLKFRTNNQYLRKLVTTIGSNTLGIYFIHIPLGVWLTSYYVQLPVSKYLVFDLLYTALLIGLALLLTLMVKQVPVIKYLVEVKSKRPKIQFKTPFPAPYLIKKEPQEVSA